MDPNDLPLWLLPIQVVILLATGNAALAAQGVPNSTASKLHGHPNAIPVEGWKPLSRRIKDERRALLQQYLEYTGSRPRWVRKEPLSGDQRAQLAGEPSEWDGGFSLTNLAIRTGSWPELELDIKRLVDAARAGHVRTIDPEGNTIGPEAWSRHWLREAYGRDGVLIMVPDPFVTIDEDNAIEPFFHRNDVLGLGRGTETSRAAPRSVDTLKPTDEAIAEFIKDLRDKLMRSGQKHGRDRLLAEAVSHFGVPRKYVLDVWKRKSLSKKKSLHGKR